MIRIPRVRFQPGISQTGNTKADGVRTLDLSNECQPCLRCQLVSTEGLCPCPALRVSDAVGLLHCIAVNDGYNTLYVRETRMTWCRVYPLVMLGAKVTVDLKWCCR